MNRRNFMAIVGVAVSAAKAAESAEVLKLTPAVSVPQMVPHFVSADAQWMDAYTLDEERSKHPVRIAVHLGRVVYPYHAAGALIGVSFYFQDRGPWGWIPDVDPKLLLPYHAESKASGKIGMLSTEGALAWRNTERMDAGLAPYPEAKPEERAAIYGGIWRWDVFGVRKDADVVYHLSPFDVAGRRTLSEITMRWLRKKGCLA